MKEVQLDPKVILELIIKYSNDMELGKNIRSYYIQKLDEDKIKKAKK
jgi:hypothetical protein